MLHISLLAVFILSIQSSISIPPKSCYCAPMDSNDMNGTEPLYIHPLNVLKDCGKEGRDTCRKLCTYLATIAQNDPRSAKSFCAKLKKDVSNIQVSVYSKACDGDYEFTGLTISEPLCCKNKEHVAC